MSEKHSDDSIARTGWIHSTRLHVVMYSLLMVVTPFLMIRRFMQEAIGQFSRMRVELGGIDVTIVPVTALILIILALIIFRAHLTRLRILAGIIAILMIALAQQIADYYFLHSFYDLQQNWHYIAYGIFAFMMYRDLAPRGIPPARIILITFICAVLFSSFDEAFQRRMSSRVFDMGDIAKDTWGAVAGMTLLYLGENPTGALLRSWKQLRHRRLSGYVTHPFSTLVLCAALALILLYFGSILSEPTYSGVVILFTIGGFVALFLVLHLSQYKWGKRILITLLVLAALVQGHFFYKYRADGIVHCEPGLVVYKGFPIWYFDVMIFPNGTFRLVDKKKYFYSRDRSSFMRHGTDIIVIGSGTAGTGGRGFPKEEIHQFSYNTNLDRGTQVIILRNPQACQVFNRLKRERKNVLFILHNTG